MEFGLIGERLGHSFSAELHRGFGQYDYELKELSPAELGPFLLARDFAGLNVTLPYKEAVLPYLDRLDPRAAAIGAVNTVVNRDGLLWGYNTDFEGMAAGIRRMFGLRAANDRPYSLTDVESACLGRAANDRPYGVSPLSGKSVLILGTGGTSKTALAVCKALGAGELLRVSRTRREDAISYQDASENHRDAELLINCTPVGMWPASEGLPLELSRFHVGHSGPCPERRQRNGEEAVSRSRLSGVFDCVYNPLRTRLVLEARNRGIPAVGGLYMLVKQAALACELFTGAKVEEAELDKSFRQQRQLRENLVLIGMPGAGKTTVGRLLAQKLGREFVDLDEAIEAQTGKSIPAIFAERGEAGFRALEARTVRALAGTGGRVLAAGGGTVLREENVTLLKQNGRLFLLDRPLEALKPSPDRPLGDTKEKLAALYQRRSPIYTAAADEIIPCGEDLNATLRAILEAR